MRKYDSYKDSGIEWIGEIPSHWEVKRLKYLSYVKTGYTPSKDNKNNYNEDGIVWAKPDDLKEYIPITDSKEKISDAGLKNQNIIPRDSVLVCCIGSIGKFGIAGCDLVTNQQINSIVFNRYINPFFGKYLIGSSVIEHDRNSNGNVVKILNAENQKNISFPVSPPSEQSAIAHYLDHKTAEIDELIADKKRLLELYEEEKTAIINQAVTKGLNHDLEGWADDHDSENQQEIKPSGKSKKSRFRHSGIEWLGEIPEHWEVVSLKWVSKIYSGGTPSKNNEDFWQNGIIPWLNSGTVNQFFITEPSEYITEEALNSSSAKWIPKNSIVIALAGQGKTKGMAAQVMFECTCNQSMGVIVPNDKIDNRFLLYYLTRNYQNIRNLGGGDKRDGINLEMVGGIPLPVIPLSEQAEIVKHIESHFSLLDAKKSKTEKLIALLTEYRTALISEVVTGKIKVTP